MRFLGDIAASVIAQCGATGFIGEFRQAPDRKAARTTGSCVRLVIKELHGLGGVDDGRARRRVLNFRQSVKYVIAHIRLHPACVGLGFAITSCIVGVIGHAGIGAGQRAQIAQAIVGIDGIQQFWIIDVSHPVKCVIAVFHFGSNTTDILQGFD